MQLAKTQAEYDEKNATLDNLIQNYDKMLADDVANERENLESNFRTLYGVKSENIPENMGFGEQMLFVTDILNKNKKVLTGMYNDSPVKITKALQDNNGKISEDGVKFLIRIIEASGTTWSEKNLLAAIKSVKKKDGTLDMDKVSFFIASLSWNGNTISTVTESIKQYFPKN